MRSLMIALLRFSTTMIVVVSASLYVASVASHATDATKRTDEVAHVEVDPLGETIATTETQSTIGEVRDMARPPRCDWWTPAIGRATATETLCTSFALRRLMSSDALSDALVRAEACAHVRGAECVLSHEVQLQVPALMLWNATEASMRMYLLPQIVRGEGEENETTTRRVALTNAQGEEMSPTLLTMNQTVVIDHVDMMTHGRTRIRLHDEAAYCMQMLVLSTPESCSVE